MLHPITATARTSREIHPIGPSLGDQIITHIRARGRSAWGLRNETYADRLHLLRTVADLDDAVGSGPNDDGIVTISCGLFAGTYATAEQIRRIASARHAEAERLALQVRCGDLRKLSAEDRERVAAQLASASPHRHREILEGVSQQILAAA